jgi:hypothetical protein
MRLILEVLIHIKDRRLAMSFISIELSRLVVSLRLPQKKEAAMSFTLTKSQGKLVIGCPDASVPDELKVDELNKIFDRIEQEKTHIDCAESDLIGIGERIKNKALPVEDGLEEAVTVDQQLETNMKKIKKSAFTVFGIDTDGIWRVSPQPGVKLSDIGIYAWDLPISEEKATFKVDIDRTLMVIKQVLKPEGSHLKSVPKWVPKRILHWIQKWAPSWNRDRPADRRANYIRGLKGICHVGLEHENESQLKLASKSLDSFREEFVANEAGGG